MAKTPGTTTVRTEPVQPASRGMGGDIKTMHPELSRLLPDYQEMRDARRGATAVKGEGTKYLPKPSGFQAQGDGGAVLYDAYIRRAQFPEIVNPTILGMAGIVHRREYQIEGLDEGSPLAEMWESASPDGLPLEALAARITEEILTVGRVGLLADMPAEGGELPYIALYRAEDIRNWSEERDFFVLKETYRERDGFAWESKTRYRVLMMEDGVYTVDVVDENGGSLIAADDKKIDVAGEASETRPGLRPQLRGGNAVEAIPFTVVGSRDLSLEPDEMPLIGVARAAYAIYRLDADYRHQLFNAGQETLFITGLEVDDAPNYVGAGVVICLPDGAKAEYVGPSGEGIDAHKVAIEDERKVAAAAGAQVLDTSAKTAESGEALRIRARAATASLVSVAIASAAGLEKVLRDCARFVGYDPEKIVVKPNLDFVDSKLSPEEIAKQLDLYMNKVISYETFYDNLQRGEIASQERSAEEEMESIALEEASVVDDEGGILEDEFSEDDELDVGDDEYGEVSEEELARLFAPEALAE